MTSTDTASLLLQAEKALPGPIRPELLTYCPTMDMIAVVTEEQVLDVYRLDGQKAFTRKRKGDDLVVESVCWKFNGGRSLRCRTESAILTSLHRQERCACLERWHCGYYYY